MTGAAPAAAPAPATQAVQALSRNIACWGDSLTNLYQWNLQQAVPDRQVYNGGVIGETSTQVTARVLADTTHREWISVFWMGHNDYTKDAIAGNVASCVAHLASGNKAFIVMSQVPWAQDGEKGTAQYDNIMRSNAQLAAAYPDNYIDIHRILVNAYNPNDPQDVADFNNDITPTSLRFDRIHLNTAGCDLVAAQIKQFLASKGW